MSWLSSQPLREKVEEHDCEVLQSSIELLKEIKTKAPFSPHITCWGDYLSRERLTDEDDEVIVEPLDPLSKTKGKGRTVSAKVWMAKGLPISLDQLLPILDLIGSANGTMKKVSSFISKVSSQGCFLVKIILPIAFTVHIQLQIKSLSLLDVHQDEFFSIPPSFTLHEPKIPESFLNDNHPQASADELEDLQEVDFERTD